MSCSTARSTRQTGQVKRSKRASVRRVYVQIARTYLGRARARVGGVQPIVARGLPGCLPRQVDQAPRERQRHGAVVRDGGPGCVVERDRGGIVLRTSVS